MTNLFRILQNVYHYNRSKRKIPRYKNHTLTKSESGGFNVWKPKLVFYKSFEHPPYCKDRCYSQHQRYLFFLIGDFIHIRFDFHHLNVLFMFFIGLNFKFSSYDFTSCLCSLLGLMLGSILDLTSGLPFSPSRFIFKLVPILKLGDEISTLLL